ncbi:unnamed protein product [Haemonchus placei]|uniref:DUF148 domain-containing protein n=1 Tax=Haemonchus placei TaxID=6290 RepID=A0A0N4W4T0_HAEPC|nr:unnamed protein product [Haemonchus placei]
MYVHVLLAAVTLLATFSSLDAAPGGKGRRGRGGPGGSFTGGPGGSFPGGPGGSFPGGPGGPFPGGPGGPFPGGVDQVGHEEIRTEGLTQEDREEVGMGGLTEECTRTEQVKDILMEDLVDGSNYGGKEMFTAHSLIPEKLRDDRVIFKLHQ